MATKKENKTALEQTVLTGLYGPPQLKRQERKQYLGQFRERVIKVLGFKQIAEPGTYPEIKSAITDPRATRLIISRRADLKAAAEYIRLARKHDVAFTTVDDPDHVGPVGLVVAASQAVDEPEVEVPDRRQRLLAAGLPACIIDAQGKGLCPKGLEQVKEKAPEELKNYRKLSWFDRLMGHKCPCSNQH